MKPRKLYTAGKLFSEYISKPYYSIAKHDFGLDDNGLFFGPLVRNGAIVLAIDVCSSILTGKPSGFPLPDYQSIMLLESAFEGTAVSFYFDHLKNKIRVKKPLPRTNPLL